MDKFATKKEDTVAGLRIVVYKGLFRESNPGPLAPKARIIPLDQTAGDKPRSALLQTHTSCKT